MGKNRKQIHFIEQNMEESIKHIYEINSVVRMSLIEVSYECILLSVEAEFFILLTVFCVFKFMV